MFGLSKRVNQLHGRVDSLRYDLEEVERRLKATRDGHCEVLCQLTRQHSELVKGIEKSGLMHYEDGESGWRKGPAKKGK